MPISAIVVETPPPNDGKVVVVGGGFIGSSFCAVFLAAGKQVVCTDPYVSEDQVKQRIATVWPTVQARGIRSQTPESPPFQRLTFTTELEAALSEKDIPLVQECSVEHIESKQVILSKLDSLLQDRPSTLIASSTSYISHDLLVEQCQHHPERVLVGHPTIPYLDSFMEIYGTSATHVQAAQAWYSRSGFEAICMKKTIPGHLFNSFLTMNMRHGSKLVKDGVCTPTDVNVVLRHMGRFFYARHGYLSLLSTIGGDQGLRGGLELSSKIKVSAISIVFFSLLKKILFFLPKAWVRRCADFMARRLQNQIEPPPAKEWIETCREFEAAVTQDGAIPVSTGLHEASQSMFERLPYEVGNDPFAIKVRSSVSLPSSIPKPL